MKKKTFKKHLMGLMLLCMGLMVSLVPAQGAANQKVLKAKTTYNTSLTGTQKHKVKYTITEVNSNDKALNLYIDGKKVLKLNRSDVLAWNVRLISVSSDRRLLYVKDTASNGYHYCMNIYEYKNKKLTLLSNLVTATRNAGKSKNKLLSSWARGDLLHVKPNSLTVRWCDSTDATGFYYQNITYKISGNKISNSDSIYTLIGPDKSKPIEWTATRAFSVTQGIGNGNTVFYVKPGDKVSGLKVARRMGNVYFCIKNSEGIAGWFDAYAVQSGTFFKEAKYAG